MMLLDLWRHRVRPPLFSPAWVKAWAKRVLSLPGVLRSACRVWRLHRAGATIAPGVFISESDIAGTLDQLTIGEETFLGRVSIQVHDRVTIGRRVCINDEVTILSASHRLDDPKWSMCSRPVTIEDYAWIAVGATVLPGVRIGRGAVVGAGAVVSRDVPDYAVATGNPARIVENRRNRELDYSPVASVAGWRAWRVAAPAPPA